MTRNHISSPKTVRNTAAVARAAYCAGISNPAIADWASIAALLYAALPAERRGKRLLDDAWADYPVNRGQLAWPAPSIAVTFADGETVRMSFASLAGKPWNLGLAFRVACAAYRSRVRRIMTGGRATMFADRMTIAEQEGFIAVPEIVAADVEQSGDVVQSVDVEVANARTAGLRSGRYAMPNTIGPVEPHECGARRAAFTLAAATHAVSVLADELETEEKARAFMAIEWQAWRTSPDYDRNLERYMLPSDDALAMQLHRARRMADAVAVFESHDVAAVPAPRPEPHVVAMVWTKERRARKATGGATRLVLRHDGKEIGCAFKAAGLYKAVATCAGKLLTVEGQTMESARAALEAGLLTRAPEAFGKPVAFSMDSGRA